jgi:subtilisin family serine protease
VKFRVTTLLILLALVFSVGVVQAKPNKAEVLVPDKLYTPDVKAEHFAFGVEASGTIASALPDVMPFWADLVDKELVSNDGEGVYVAVLDTGLLEDWPFFFSQANIAWELGKGYTHDLWWDDALGDIVFGPLRDDRGFLTDPFMGSGHGTHVASTVVGFNVNDSYWVTGIAPKATIIPVLVLDAWLVATPTGLMGLAGGTDEMVAAGINYVADLSDSLDGPVVINMSLGGPDQSPMIEDAVDYAISKGVIVVASAGNEGALGMGYPGGYPQIISAAAGGWTEHYVMGWQADVPEALNTEDYFGNPWRIYLEDFSSRPNKDLGQKHQDLDVTTPGAGIVGPYKPYFSTVVGYYTVWGTSQAAPHVSGIASLVLQSHAGMGQASMESILKNAARGLPLPASDAYLVDHFGEFYASWDGGDYGAGFLQADEAMRVAGIFDK